MRLSTQAGWNQLAVDWRRLVALWPDGCLAGWDGNDLVATASLAVYQRLGWIGMIIVDQDHRARGHGAAMFRAVLDHAEEIGVDCLGLDATDEGRRVYLKFGFVDHHGVDRWGGTGAQVTPSGTTQTLGEEHVASLGELDLRLGGVDRSRLLRRLASEPGATVRMVTAAGDVVAAGFSRSGRTAGHIGPVIASSSVAGEAIVADLITERFGQGEEQVLIDIPHDGPLAETVERWGFTAQRRLMRMIRTAGVGITLSGPGVFAVSGLELG